MIDRDKSGTIELSRTGSQIVGIDLLRFFASAFVVLFHLQFWRNGLGPASGFAGLSNIAWAGWIGVQIFFVISGFVITFSAEGSSASKFLIGRFSRLFPSIFLCTALTSVVLIQSESLGSVLNKIFKTLILWPYGPSVDVVYWTLSIEIIFYGFVFVFILWDRGRNIYNAIRILGLVSVMFWILRLTFSLFYVHGLSEILLKLEFSKAFQVTLLYHGLYFALGAAFFKRDWHWAPIFLIGAFIELHFRAQQFSQYSPATPMVVWVSSIAFILFSININNLIHNKTPWLAIIARRLGMLTYPLYLIHNEIGVFVEKKGSSFGLDDRTAFAVSFVGVILLGSAIAFAYEQKMQIVFKKALGALLKRVQDVRNARARAA